MAEWGQSDFQKFRLPSSGWCIPAVTAVVVILAVFVGVVS